MLELVRWNKLYSESYFLDNGTPRKIFIYLSSICVKNAKSTLNISLFFANSRGLIYNIFAIFLLRFLHFSTARFALLIIFSRENKKAKGENLANNLDVLERQGEVVYRHLQDKCVTKIKDIEILGFVNPHAHSSWNCHTL